MEDHPWEYLNLQTGTSLAIAISMRIGVDSSIAGEPELCLMTIGLDQPIGNVVVRDLATGLFGSLTKLMNFGRRLIGRYLDVEPVELESRPTPRRAPAPAARLVLAIALVVVAAVRPDPTAAEAIVALALLAGARVARAAAGYLYREFVIQWRLALYVVAPALVILAWVRWH